MTPLVLEGQQGGDYLLAGASRMTTTSTHALEPQAAKMALAEELVDEFIRIEMTRIREDCNNPPGSPLDGIDPHLMDSSFAHDLLPNDDEA